MISLREQLQAASQMSKWAEEAYKTAYETFRSRRMQVDANSKTIGLRPPLKTRHKLIKKNGKRSKRTVLRLNPKHDEWMKKKIEYLDELDEVNKLAEAVKKRQQALSTAIEKETHVLQQLNAVEKAMCGSS